MRKQVPSPRQSGRACLTSPAPSARGVWEGRRAYGSVIGIYAVVLAGVTLPTPLYVAYQDQWLLTNGMVTLLYALYPIGVLAVLMTAGHWADLFGRRVVMTLALACSSLSAVTFLTASSPWVVATGRVLTGVASGFAVNGANALLVELASPARRRSASVLSSVVNQFGLAMGAAASAVLVQYAWAPTRLVFASHLAAMAVAAVLLRSVPETVVPTHRVSLRRRSLRFQSLQLPQARRGEFWAASLAAFTAFALCGLLAALAPTIVREELDTTNAIFGGGAVTLVFLASGLSQLGWMKLPDVPVLYTGAVLLVVALATMTGGVAGPSMLVFLMGVTFGGLAVGALFMSSLAIVNRAAEDERRGRVTATYFTSTFSGLVLPVVGTGVIADHLTQLQATGIFAAGISAIAVLSAVLMWRARRTGRRTG